MLTNQLHQYHHPTPQQHHYSALSVHLPPPATSHAQQHQQQPIQLLRQSTSTASTSAAVHTTTTASLSPPAYPPSRWDRHQTAQSSDVTMVLASSQSTVVQPGQSPSAHQPQHECSGCGRSISERYLLRAVDRFWHEDCLKCSCCDCRLGEVGSTLFAKANLLLCRRDYLRLFGATGYCSACSKMIPAFEMVMKAKDNVYHLECFACQQCNHRFCIGDRYYLCDNRILCQFDYEERMTFARMSHGYSVMSQMKRQVAAADGAARGAGCRSPTQHSTGC